MTANELEKKQEELFLEIKQHADKKGLIRKNLQPIYDGVADIPAYLSSNPKIMWILKEPWHLYTASGNPKGGDWYFTKHFNTPEVWKDQEMWKVMIQINYGIRNNLKWFPCDLFFY